MRASRHTAILAIVLLASGAQSARAQTASIGYVYPAGGRQGTTFQAVLGGQGLDGVNRAWISGSGVKARVVEYNKRMNNQEVAILSEQLRELKALPSAKVDAARARLLERLPGLIEDSMGQPASVSIANRVVVEVTVASEAEPGPREIRLGTPRALSNPLVFHIGQLPEVTAPPTPVSPLVTLGKEAQSVRRRLRQPASRGSGEMAMSMMVSGSGGASVLDDEVRQIRIPCVANGQITQGSVDRYAFAARKGHRLVISVQARDLIPYIADAVPGWFQSVIALYDAQGREVAYDDDYRFKPDSVILYEVPADGEYLLAVRDAIYRGREDFVYRVTIGEMPFVTEIFPLGGRVGVVSPVEVRGWNLVESTIQPPVAYREPGITAITARGRDWMLSPPIPFALDVLPERMEQEPNNVPEAAQRVNLPVIVNGRVDKPGDRDVFRFEGRAGDPVVAEVLARRLDSPLDSVLKLTDASGRCLARNDDAEDAMAGLNTHPADSYLRAVLPADGTYFVQLEDAQHAGGMAYAYRLRISPPQADFALRVVPASLAIRPNNPGVASVHVVRKDGFAGPIRLSLQNPPPGIDMPVAVLSGTQTLVRVSVRTSLASTMAPVRLTLVGAATVGQETIVREAVPAEDRMQAFLWRHLVPAREWMVQVLAPPPKKTPPGRTK